MKAQLEPQDFWNNIHACLPSSSFSGSRASAGVNPSCHWVEDRGTPHHSFGSLSHRQIKPKWSCLGSIPRAMCGESQRCISVLKHGSGGFMFGIVLQPQHLDTKLTTKNFFLHLVLLHNTHCWLVSYIRLFMSDNSTQLRCRHSRTEYHHDGTCRGSSK